MRPSWSTTVFSCGTVFSSWVSPPLIVSMSADDGLEAVRGSLERADGVDLHDADVNHVGDVYLGQRVVLRCFTERCEDVRERLLHKWLLAEDALDNRVERAVQDPSETGADLACGIDLTDGTAEGDALFDFVRKARRRQNGIQRVRQLEVQAEDLTRAVRTVVRELGSDSRPGARAGHEKRDQ